MFISHQKMTQVPPFSKHATKKQSECRSHDVSFMLNHQRRHMFRNPIRFNGDVSKQRMVETASPLLLHLVNLNLGRYSNDSFNTSEPVSLNMCPFLQFNAKKKKHLPPRILIITISITCPMSNHFRFSQAQLFMEKQEKARSSFAWPTKVSV